MATVITSKKFNLPDVDEILAGKGYGKGLTTRSREDGTQEVETTDPRVPEPELSSAIDQAPVYDPATAEATRLQNALARQAQLRTLRTKPVWTNADRDTAIRLLIERAEERGD